jgi:hypothetical protein
MRDGDRAAHGGAYAALASGICADDAYAMAVYDGDAAHGAAGAAAYAAYAAEYAVRLGLRWRAFDQSIQRQADKLIEVIGAIAVTAGGCIRGSSDALPSGPIRSAFAAAAAALGCARRRRPPRWGGL